MLKLAVIGGGAHCSENHLPALARFREEHPGSIEFTAFCDRDQGVIDRISRTWPFCRHYRSVSEMIESETLDGCIAVTPIEQTASVAIQLLEAGIPLLLEKPPGKNLEEARLICATVERTATPAMVSMNRRFDPVLMAARDYLASRAITHIKASICRIARHEPTFFRDTAIHAVDAIRSLAGEINGYSLEVTNSDGIRRYAVDFRFACGANGRFHADPDSGKIEERYAFAGPGWTVVARSGAFDEGSLEIRENGQVVQSICTPPTTPDYIKNGTYNETAAFLEALLSGSHPTPSPAEVVESVRICTAINGDRAMGCFDSC